MTLAVCAVCGGFADTSGTMQHRRWCASVYTQPDDSSKVYLPAGVDRRGDVRCIHVREDGTVFAYDKELHIKVDKLIATVASLMWRIDAAIPDVTLKATLPK